MTVQARFKVPEGIRQLHPDHFLLPVETQTMEPVMQVGYFAFVTRKGIDSLPENQWTEPIVFKIPDGYGIGRVMMFDTQVLVTFDNPNIEGMVVPKNEISIEGIVLGVHPACDDLEGDLWYWLYIDREFSTQGVGASE